MDNINGDHTVFSFDVWNTLVTSNPEFARLRTEMLADMFHVDEPTMKAEYTRVKTFSDLQAEYTGAAHTTPELCALLIKRMRDSRLTWEYSHVTVPMIEDCINRLFLQHPPIIKDDTIHLLSELRKTHTLIIASNSNFISGQMMYPYLQRVTDNAFQAGVFSDVVQHAKPSKAFFDKVFEVSCAKKRSDVVHVGDNMCCDVSGADAAGMQYMLVQDPTDTVSKLRKFVSHPSST